ncbi:MAG: tRNA adenosine(34) deaminase TadA [Actinomycetaceae bacterium]|nr:tRNA adenosine(34) deaminase TadA [Actinomycetaceae bacterium]
MKRTKQPPHPNATTSSRTIPSVVLSRYNAAMTEALNLAQKAATCGDVPVGAVVQQSDGYIIGRGYNQRETPPFDPSAHAEVIALREAAKHLQTWRLEGCTLVVTLEPCAMCAGAIVLSRIDRLVFGAWDDKAGACGSLRDIVRDKRLNHRVEVIGGLRHDEAAQQLQEFFGR